VILILLGGAIDLGRVFYAKISIADAAREGALWAAQHPNSWMQGCDASQPISASNPNQVTCHVRNEAAAGLVTIKSTDVKCSSTAAPTFTACMTDSPAAGGTVYVAVTGQFTTIMGGFTFNLGTTAVGRIVQMPPPFVAAAQTITFGPIPDKDVGMGSLTAVATATSGLAVTFATTTPSVCGASGMNGSTILLSTVGTCSVVASQAGNAQWAAAPNVSQSFQVTPPPPPTPPDQIITFPPMGDHMLGAGSPIAAATASSSLPVTFTTTTPTICAPAGPDGSTISLLAAGVCTVKADQPGDGGVTWNAAPPVLQSFNVTPPPPVCNAPTLTFTISPTSGVATKNAGHPGTTFTFDATGSTVNPDCHAVWSWNFGNGSGTSSTPFQTTYIYPDPGPDPLNQFTVTLGVTVDGGASSSATRTVRVAKQ
jgi:Flp pilus assembly protein TadG